MLMKFYSLRSLREACGLTQVQLAKRLGCCVDYCRTIENGERELEEMTQTARKLLYEMAEKMELDYNSLRIMRLRANLTQKQAAGELGISLHRYNEVERGQVKTHTHEDRARAIFQRAIEDLERTGSDD